VELKPFFKSTPVICVLVIAGIILIGKVFVNIVHYGVVNPTYTTSSQDRFFYFLWSDGQDLRPSLFNDNSRTDWRIGSRSQLIADCAQVCSIHGEYIPAGKTKPEILFGVTELSKLIHANKSQLKETPNTPIYIFNPSKQ
jgi:hypothetical protein